jgi:hypothetical protein
VVFDLVWLAVLSRFPKCIEATVRAGVLADCPLASGVLVEKGGSGQATDQSLTDRRQGWCRDLEVGVAAAFLPGGIWGVNCGSG